MWEFQLDLGDAPDIVAERIRDVVGVLVRQSAENWPSDQYWEDRLPGWLKSKMLLVSVEEAEQIINTTPRQNWNDLPWEFGSWIDAIRERQWRWWGFEYSGRDGKIVLEVLDIPPRVTAFKQIVSAAGARIVSERSTL